MASKRELMAAGLPALAATMLGQTLQDTLSAAGTTQATATSIIEGFAVFTTVGASSGGIMPTAGGKSITVVVNAGANTLTVYPAVGEKFNNGAANAGVQIASGKAGLFVPSANRWAAIIA